MIAESTKKFEPHPAADGPIRAVVVDITDPKEKQTTYGMKWKFAIVFETETKDKEGKNWTFWSHGYTAVKDGENFRPILGDRSNFQKDALKIFGLNKLPERFDTDDLIGKPVRLIIEHKNDEGTIYANMTWLGPDKDPDAMKPSGHYVRQRDKKKEDATNTGASYQKADAPTEQKQGWQNTKVHVGKFKGQELENLDEDAIKALIDHWIPSTKADGYKVTADDKRLLAALDEVQKLLAGAGGVPVEPKF
jgi:hypothetical protein